MSERDFSFGGRTFKMSKVNAIKQFHIVRRIGPILSELLPQLKGAAGVKNIESMSESDKLDVIAKFASPVMMGLSKLSDEEAEFVLFGLLNSVEVQQPAGNWARVASEKMLMIQDLELPQMLQIAGRAFLFNLSNFFSAHLAQSA